MSKKGLISSLIVGLVVTIALGIYTLVSVFGGTANPKGPQNTDIVLAYRTGDVIDVFKGYNKDDVKFSYPETNVGMPWELDEETGCYKAVSEGEVYAVVTLNKKGDTNSYKIKIWRHTAENTSEENPYIVANKDHLIELANNFNGDVNAQAPAYVKIGGDIDLSGVDFKPIGYVGHEYNGYINGNGFKITNLKLTIDENNYKDFLHTAADNNQSAQGQSINRAYLDLGLFGAYKDNTIKNLSVENAVINVADAVYKAMTEETFEQTPYKKFARVSAGALAGNIENADIIGAEGKSNISARISAFSFTQDGYAHGIGGMVGVGRLVRISNYAVKTTVINNTKEVVSSNIGGVVGYVATTFNYGGSAINAEMKNKIDNVAVQFDADVVYNNKAYVGGIAARAYSVDIINSSVDSFKVNDPAIRGNIDFSLASKDTTLVAGVVADLVSDDNDQSKQYLANITNVKVSGIEVNILGGRAAGVAGILGINGSNANPVNVKNTTVVGSNKITAHFASGFAYQVGPDVTVEYSEDITDLNVINIDLAGHLIAGFANYNLGKIKGFAKTVTEEAEEEQEPVVRTDRPIVNVTLTNMGAEINNTLAATLKLLRTNTHAAGLVGFLEKSANASVIPELSGFKVNVTASNGVNYSGVCYEIKDAKASDILVDANFTSYTGLDSNSLTFSTTYSVAGVANIANAGSEISKCEVKLNLNSDENLDKTKAYGASFVAGLVARYTGDTTDKGLTLNENTVSGNAYVNYMYHEVAFENDGVGGEENIFVPIFVGGGLIGMMASITAAGFDTNYDAISAISIAQTKALVTSNKVENFTISAEFAKENEELTAQNKVLYKLAYRVRAIGALVGVIYTQATSEDQLDLSSNTMSKVLIRAYERTFTYSYDTPIQGSNNNVTLGGNYQHTYGISFKLNTGTSDVNEGEFDPNNKEVVDYEKLGQTA